VSTVAEARTRFQIVLASYAALVATVALGWNIFQYVDNKPKLEAQIQTGSPNEQVPSGKIPGLYPEIRFLNKGSKPLTIYFMQATFRTQQPPGIFLLNNPFPIKLDSGDAKEWDISDLYSSPKSVEELMHSSHAEGKLQITLLTTTGKFETESTVTLYSYPHPINPTK